MSTPPDGSGSSSSRVRDRPDRHRVVVIGAGFGGLAVARELRTAPVDVTVIDANNFHTFQPLLYQVATAGLSADDVAHPIRGVFGRGQVSSLMGEVVEIDTDQHVVVTREGVRTGYDTLVIAAGAVSNDFGIEGIEEHAVPLKTLGDALEINRRLLATFERADRDVRHDGPLRTGTLDVVIAGGGPTGVELAGGIAELYAKVLADDFPDLPVSEARIVIVEMADRVLSAFSERSSARARHSLEALGVEVRCGVGVRRVDESAVELDDGSRIEADTTIWAAGVKAHPIAAALGVGLARGGRIVVDHDLSVVGVDDVFAIGDIAAVEGADGVPLPQVAQPAIQGGRHVARQILRRLEGRPTTTFSYTDKGSMATIGRHSAVAELPNGWKLGGWIGWVSWLLLHLVYLVGFRNRLVVFVNWCWNYLTFDRPSRLLSARDAIVDDDRRHRPDGGMTG